MTISQVGHEKPALSPRRTFQSLYVNPIREVLEMQNRNTQYSNNSRWCVNPFRSTIPDMQYLSKGRKLMRRVCSGVFDEDCFQTLYLWVDVKTDVTKTWPLVEAALAPLREGNWLTKWDGKIMIPGPVTVIGTGFSTWKGLIGNRTRPRDYFVDAPLLGFGTDNEEMGDDGKPLYDRTSSFFASADLKHVTGHIGAEIDAKGLKNLKRLVNLAKERHMLTRFWGAPNWPVRTRRNVFRQLMEFPVGLLNADDVEDAANGDW
ncbi:hypothetical protein ABW21_db0208284 [Orbilia brochopaga]|nr:hypothetical protein ABW21_db0208284 [Drechslerella brochopaga]